MKRSKKLSTEEEKLLHQITDVEIRKKIRKRLKNEHGCIRFVGKYKLDGWEEDLKYHQNKLDKLVELIKEKPNNLPLYLYLY